MVVEVRENGHYEHQGGQAVDLTVLTSMSPVGRRVSVVRLIRASAATLVKALDRLSQRGSHSDTSVQMGHRRRGIQQGELALSASQVGIAEVLMYGVA